MQRLPPSPTPSPTEGRRGTAAGVPPRLKRAASVNERMYGGAASVNERMYGSPFSRVTGEGGRGWGLPEEAGEHTIPYR